MLMLINVKNSDIKLIEVNIFGVISLLLANYFL